MPYCKLCHIILAMFVALPLVSSCSLDYKEVAGAEASVPELSLHDAKYSLYKDAAAQIQLEAKELEQYKGEDILYARDVAFTSLSKEGKLNAKGTCELLYANTKTKDYSMFSKIFIEDQEHGIEISASNIKWNGSTEQLVSGLEDYIVVKKDNIEITGSGFSASGVSRKFVFTKDVQGKINIKDAKD